MMTNHMVRKHLFACQIHLRPAVTDLRVTFVLPVVATRPQDHSSSLTLKTIWQVWALAFPPWNFPLTETWKWTFPFSILRGWWASSSRITTPANTSPKEWRVSMAMIKAMVKTRWREKRAIITAVVETKGREVSGASVISHNQVRIYDVTFS